MVLVALFCAIYAPEMGQGFVKDDFQWITDARAPFPEIFATTSGFYRPLVTLSFRANDALFGLHSYPYALTNLALALACAVALFWLVRSFALPGGAALVAAALWAFNFHGINMSVMWISGRTALLLTLFALLAAIACLHRRRWWGALAISAALLSKEEAVLLPIALLTWQFLMVEAATSRERWAHAARQAPWLLVPLAIYLVVRSQTDAMTPFDAPDYYRFAFAPDVVARNLYEYLDRSATFAVGGLLFLWAFARRSWVPDAARRRVVWCGLVWFACGLAITIFLPVRSSLYACFPSAGASLAAAAVVAGWLEAMPPARVRRAAVAALLILAALMPVYHARNRRWVEIADLSRATIQTLAPCAKAPCDALLLEDDLRTRRNFTSTFGSFDSGARLFLGRSIPTTVVLSPPSARLRPAEGGCILHVRLIDTVPRAQLKGQCT